MACTSFTLRNITTSCDANVSSIKKMWIGKFESATWTPKMDTTDATKIESVTGTLASGADKWVEFAFRKNTASFDTEMTINDNGSHYFSNTINLVFAKIENEKRLALESVASGDCSAIVLDGNNQYWLFGYDTELNVSTLTATTGTAVGDNNQYELALSEAAATMPIAVSDGMTTVEALTE